MTYLDFVKIKRRFRKIKRRFTTCKTAFCLGQKGVLFHALFCLENISAVFILSLWLFLRTLQRF